MEDIDIRHIHILEFPKQLLWTDRDLEYFLEEMPGEANRMNNDIYDVLIKEMTPGQDFSPEEAFNLAYYECVRISWAKYPESKDIFDVLEMDIQHNQSHTDYGFTDLIMNMVWAMLHSTGKAHRFADKLYSYLLQCDKQRFWFRSFSAPNDFEHSIFPYEEKEEPKYDLKFTPCPDDMRFKPSVGEWCKLTIGYKEHLIEELLMLWPIEKRETIRKRIMDEKAGQLNNFEDFAKKHIVEIIDEPETHLHINLREDLFEKKKEDDKVSLNSLRRVIRRENFRNDTIQQIRKANQDSDEIERLKLECEEWKAKYEEAVAKEPEKAFNPQTGQPCFTSRQMGLFLTAVGRITEKDNPPGKTTLGEVVSRIAGYKPSAATTNMKGKIPKTDIEAVVKAIESKFPNLAREVRRV